MQKGRYQTLFISYTIFTAANVVKGNDGCLVDNFVDINSNCDLQFVDDGNEFEINLYHCHIEKDLLLPTTIITNYRTPSNFPGLNIHSGRIAKCKLVLIFLIHLQIVNTEFQGIAAKSEWLSEYFLASGNTNWTRLKKLFLLFIADGAVQTIGSYSAEDVVLQYFSIQLMFGSLDYVGIAYFANRNLIELCIYPFGLGFEHQHCPEEIICVKKASNVEKLISIASPPKFWLVFNSVHRLVYLPRNPFIPTANYSYITYLYSAVFQRINGTIIPADKDYTDFRCGCYYWQLCSRRDFPFHPVLRKKAFFRTVLGAWFLMSVILTNCYNGIMTSELNAPLQGRHPITFNDLVCSKIKHSKQNPDYVLSIGRNISALDTYVHKAYHKQIRQFMWNLQPNSSLLHPITSFDCFKLLSNLVNVAFDQRQIPEFLDLLYDIHTSLLDPGAPNGRQTLSEHFISPVFDLMFKLLNPMHAHTPASVNYSTYTVETVRKLVENEIVSCGKAVFAGTSESYIQS
ncbi:hypothetical protein Fcan01_24433 [Folsomia candida]|uniref:Uncharacterized protein n=1 Tax=Folsomia candida TaxID=158441 RepID=A0A226D710_FOLCA|nr:hypothetical protein Fcan01_24433 [Folsomia candida]